jgi:hypothetical protein
VAAYALGAGLQAADAKPPATNAPPASVALPKSVFIGNDPGGRDPFFPNSARRFSKPADKAAESAAPTVGPSVLLLRGITGPADRRIALINNRTFAAGEEGKVRASGAEFTIRCLEIRERSVIVTIEGSAERHEIQLPERSLPLSTEGRPSE